MKRVKPVSQPMKPMVIRRVSLEEKVVNRMLGKNHSFVLKPVNELTPQEMDDIRRAALDHALTLLEDR